MRKFKLLSIVVLAALSVGVFSACGDDGEEENESSYGGNTNTSQNGGPSANTSLPTGYYCTDALHDYVKQELNTWIKAGSVSSIRNFDGNGQAQPAIHVVDGSNIEIVFEALTNERPGSYYDKETYSGVGVTTTIYYYFSNVSERMSYKMSGNKITTTSSSWGNLTYSDGAILNGSTAYKKVQ